MAALPHDASGFLVGERLVNGIDLVGKDTAEILKILKGAIAVQAKASNRMRVAIERLSNAVNDHTIDVSPRRSARQGRSDSRQPLPTIDVGAPSGSQSPIPPTQEPSNSPSPRRGSDQGNGNNDQGQSPDSSSPDGRQNNGRRRNSRGQFESNGQGNEENQSNDENQADDKKKKEDKNESNGVLKAIREGFAINADTRNIDPTVDAVRELGTLMSPLAKVGKTMFKGVAWLFRRKKKREEPSDQEQRQQTRIEKLLKRIAGSRVGAAARSGSNLLSGIGGGLSSLFGMGGNLLSGLAPLLMRALVPALGLTAAFKFGEWVGGKIYDAIGPKLGEAVDWTVDAVKAIPEKIGKAWDSVVGAASKGIEGIADWVKGVADKATEAYDATVTKTADVMQVVADGTKGIFNYLTGKYDATVSKVADGMVYVAEKSQVMTGGKTSNVVNAGGGYTDVKQADGSTVRRTGARNWRNNNPGNIRKGDYANSMGAIGDDGSFAVFPDYETGRKAKESLIFDSNKGKALSTKADYGAGLGYKDKTLKQMIASYAPPEDKNDLAAYQNKVLSVVGGVNKRMSEYTPQERQRIMTAMEQQEGFKVGKEVVISPAAPSTKPSALVAVNQPTTTPILSNMIANPLGAIGLPTFNLGVTQTIAPSMPAIPPKVAAKPMPEIPKQKQQVSTKEQPPMKVSVVGGNETIGQNLSDRHLAHAVTGGLGMDALRHG